jgi:probable addiction module antidote protein
MKTANAVATAAAVSAPYESGLHTRLRDATYAAAYLTAAMEDDEPIVYLQALRHVAEAHGMAKIAEASGIPRESLYRALSAKGNPRWSTLAAILKGTGLQLTIAPVPKARKSVRAANPSFA